MDQNRFFLGLLMFVFVLPLVFSLGGSTGGSGTTPSSPSTNNSVPSSQPSDAVSFAIVCEQNFLYDRVKCRLENKPTAESIPEACRALTLRDACIQMYRDVAPCYQKTGKSKDACFRTVAGFSQATVTAQAALNKTAVKKYSIFLLYDLQERVENAYNSGKINSSKAAEIITAIDQAKQALLVGKPASEANAYLIKVKRLWKESMQ